MSVETAQKEAIDQIRKLRYGTQGKDYFWINDMHPFMIMHPYRSDLEGRDLTLFRDRVGNYPFVSMVKTVMDKGSGFVNYHWQWKDIPEQISPKISFVAKFEPWEWIVGTGIYIEDIDKEIHFITQELGQIFGAVFLFIIGMSFYISKQVFHIERKKNDAEYARNLEENRLKGLFQLGQMTDGSSADLIAYTIKETVTLTKSQSGFMAFYDESTQELTVYSGFFHNGQYKTPSGNDKQCCFLSEAGLWADPLRSLETVVINSGERLDPAIKDHWPMQGLNVFRMISIPVFEAGKIVAVAGLANKSTAYDSSDIRHMSLMMDGLWKIIQKKRSSDALQKSEERYRLLAENASDMILVMRLEDLTFTYVSPSVEYILGYSGETIKKVDLQGILTRTSYEKAVHVLEDELGMESLEDSDPGRYRTLELEMVKKDGTGVWVEVTTKFLRDDHGRPDRVLGISRDITRRRKLEKELVKINYDLQLAQKIAGVGNWSLDPSKGIPEWSEQVYRIYERDPEKGPYPLSEYKRIYQKKWFDIFSSAINNAIEKGMPYDIELKLTLPSGKIKWINTICEPDEKRTEAGHFLRGTIQDITDRKKMEERIQQTQKMEALGTLAGGIAHDFNNILSAMLGFTELAKMRTTEDEDTQKHLSQVLSSGLRARELVRHILTFSRKSDTHKDLIRIAPLIKETVKFLKASIPPDIRIVTRLEKPDATITADPTQIHQVLMNLFTNAVQAMKENIGILTITLDTVALLNENDCSSKKMKPGPYVKLSVSDTGCGIPDHLIDKIFEPFFTTKKRGEGTGMGLSLSYGIIKDLNGQMSVYSEPGRGTTFHILIPEQKDVQVLSDLPDHAEPMMAVGNGRKVLLVDDEKKIVAWTEKVLTRLGYDVVTATGPREALKKFEKMQDSLDLVVTDLSMPEMTGIQMAGRIKKIRGDIPIILSTGFSEGLSSRELSENGISQVIMKPMIAGELASIIKNHALSKQDGHDG